MIKAIIFLAPGFEEIETKNLVFEGWRRDCISKSLDFYHAQGAGGENCLLFGIREREAGRLHIPMDNVCSAYLPPSRLAHDPSNINRISFAPMLRNRDQKLRF